MLTVVSRVPPPIQPRLDRAQCEELCQAQQSQRGSGRVEIHQHVHRIRPSRHHDHEQPQHDDAQQHSPRDPTRTTRTRTRTQSHPYAAARPHLHPPIAQQEPQLLHEQPHEDEVGIPDRRKLRSEPHGVDDHDATAQAEQCHRGPQPMHPHHDRHHRRHTDVDREEPERLGHTQPRLCQKRWIDPEAPRQCQSRPHHQDHRRRGESKAPHTTPNELCRRTAPALHTSPVLGGGEASHDEEQRHDLDQPADRSEPLRARQRDLRAEAPVGRPLHTDHEGVQHHHDENARRPHDVHGLRPDGAGDRSGASVGAVLGASARAPVRGHVQMGRRRFSRCRRGGLRCGMQGCHGVSSCRTRGP